MTAVEPYPCGPAADGVDGPYWEAMSRGELALQRCGACGTWRWTARDLCSSCYSFDVSWETVEPTGVVYSWIRTWHPYMSELGDTTPYLTVLVELPQAGDVRVLGMMATSGERPVRIGDPVVGVFEQPANASRPLLRWIPA